MSVWMSADERVLNRARTAVNSRHFQELRETISERRRQVSAQVYIREAEW